MNRIIVLAAFAVVSVTTAQTLNERSALGINIQGVIDYSSELHFINYAKRARAWIPQCDGCRWGMGPALDLDENGYIKKLDAGQKATLILATPPFYVPGEHIVYFKGNGRLVGQMGASGTVTQSGQSVTFKTGDQGYVVLSLEQTDPADYIRDIEVIPADMLEIYKKGETFWPSFKQNWAKYRHLRFMDWGHTNNHPNGTWSSRSKTTNYSYGIDNGVPYEVMIRLANEMSAYPWFCIPHLADNDYVRKMAELVRDSLRNDLLIYVEHSNEVWNGVFSGQYSYCDTRGQALRAGGASFDGLSAYHAVRTAQIMEIWSEVLGRQRLIGVLAVGGPSDHMINVGMTYLKKIGKDHLIDVASIAPYVGANVKYSTVDEAITGLMGSFDSYEKTVFNLKAVANKYNLRLNAYEGGQHLWNFGQQFNKEGEKAQGDPRMHDFVTRYMNTWKAKGGDEFTLFASGGGFWGQIPWGVEPMNAAKYKAHNDFIENNPIWYQMPEVRIERVIESTRGHRMPAMKQDRRLYNLQGRPVAAHGIRGLSPALLFIDGSAAVLRIEGPR